MAKHRKFNVDRFLAKFEGLEEILSAYARRWKTGMNVSKLDVYGFRLSSSTANFSSGSGSATNNLHARRSASNPSAVQRS